MVELHFPHNIGTPHVLRATPADDERIVPVLVRAFEDDPIINWAFRADESRDLARKLYFETQLELAHPHNTVFTIDPRLACAIWVPPGHWKVSRARQAFLLPRITRMLGPRRFARGIATYERLQQEHAQEPHYYLNVLGVDPSCQAQGLGSALVRAGLDLADREGVGAYVETSNPRNLPLYKRHGFEVKKSFELEAQGAKGPTCWLMWRPPARAAK
jgi:ribosomal protein S18 acetylase RimI-like enzyme